MMQYIIDAQAEAIMNGVHGPYEVDGLLDGSTVVLRYESEPIVEGDQVTGYQAVLINVFLKTEQGDVMLGEWLRDDVFESLQEQLEEILAEEF
jgi:hypothetical protein